MFCSRSLPRIQNVPTRLDNLPAPSLSQRSHSAAPADYHQRRGSLSPTHHQQQLYQPQQQPQHLDEYGQPIHGGQPATQAGGPRFQSRSATATPTGSPKKRQLPQVPTTRSASLMRDRLSQELLDEQASGAGVGRFSRHRTRQTPHQQTYRSTGMGGWERHYAGLSDSDLTMRSTMMDAASTSGGRQMQQQQHYQHQQQRNTRNSLSPDKDFLQDFGDSDMESVVSVTSSAFSTQSERPQGSRGMLR